MEDMVKYLNGEGEIGIIDATNTTLKRRNFIRSFLTTNLQDFQLLWIESIITDPLIIQQNIERTKIRSPDFIDKTEEETVKIFQERIKQYEDIYEPISEDEENSKISFIKLINAG